MPWHDLIKGPLESLFMQWLCGPKLILKISPAFSKASEEKTGDDKFYARVEVTNVKRKTAYGCQGYLIGLDEWNEERQRFETVFSDTRPLIWSRDPHTQKLDISKKIPRIFDVVLYNRGHAGLDLQLWSEGGPVLRPPELQAFREKSGKFRFRVRVSAFDLPPKEIAFKVTWDGKNWPPKLEEGM